MVSKVTEVSEVTVASVWSNSGLGSHCYKYATGTKTSCPTTCHDGAWGGEGRYSSYSFLTSALDGGQWSLSCPRCTLASGKGPPSTHCVGGWVGPRAGLDTEARGKILSLVNIVACVLQQLPLFPLLQQCFNSSLS
jgi:hypothetical protein